MMDRTWAARFAHLQGAMGVTGAIGSGYQGVKISGGIEEEDSR